KEMRFVERFRAQAAKASQVQSRVKKLDKIERIAPPRRLVEKRFDFRAPARSGEDVIRVEGVRKTYGPKVVHQGLSLLVRRRERWASMRENGAGKPTPLKMMAGAATPDAGSVTIGAAVVMGYFAQHQMEILDIESTVMGELERHAPTASRGVLCSLAGAFG